MLDALTDNPHGCDGAPLGIDPLECSRIGDDRPWYVVRCDPDALRPKMYHGGRVESGLLRPALHRLGVTTFLPLERKDIPDKRLGKRTVTVPAFAGCLFAQWGPRAEWWRILALPGVLRHSGAGLIRPVGDPHGHPQAVPAGFMAGMLAGAVDGGVIYDTAAPPRLPPIAPNTPVRIARGPFAGHTGLCGMSSAQRVAVLFEIMGATRTVTARRRDVEAL